MSAPTPPACPGQVSPSSTAAADPAPTVPSDPEWVLLPLAHGTPAESVARDWLGARLGQSPRELPLPRDDRRRPRFVAPLDRHDCNWSHSGDRLAVALGRDVAVGIDLERERPRPRALEIARRYFCREEAEQLAALPALQRERAFLQLWCAKEAVLKAHGHGLAFGLDRLMFDDLDGRFRLQRCDPALGRPEEWQLQLLTPAEGYLGALAWRPRR